jgi:hypothetical protein
MTRTQVQLPDQLYQDLRALADEREWSLAEAIRRGAELLLARYPPARDAAGAWSLPEAVHLGGFVAPVEAWRELANTRDGG